MAVLLARRAASAALLLAAALQACKSTAKQVDQGRRVAASVEDGAQVKLIGCPEQILDVGP